MKTVKINITAAAEAFETSDNLLPYYEAAAEKLGVEVEETEGPENQKEAQPLHDEVLRARMADPDAR